VCAEPKDIAHALGFFMHPHTDFITGKEFLSHLTLPVCTAIRPIYHWRALNISFSDVFFINFMKFLSCRSVSGCWWWTY